MQVLLAYLRIKLNKRKGLKSKNSSFFFLQEETMQEYIKGKVGYLKSKNGFNVLAEKNKL